MLGVGRRDDNAVAIAARLASLAGGHVYPQIAPPDAPSPRITWTLVSVEDLAHRVGISVAHLNSICRELAGQSALQILHQRLLLEAKRHLIYTPMTISEVADQLGFADPAYFARFFRRLTGTSPSAYRADTAAFTD